MLKALHYCHEIVGVIQKDIKPDNILMGETKDLKDARLIDFGQALRFKDDHSEHIENKRLKKHQGYPAFLSKNVLKCNTPSRRDDLIALILSLVYMMNRDVSRYYGDRKLIAEARLKESNSEICNDNAKEFESILDYLDTLKFEEEPNYGRLYFSFQMIILESSKKGSAPCRPTIKKEETKTEEDASASKKMPKKLKLAYGIKMSYESVCLENKIEVGIDDEAVPEYEAQGVLEVLDQEARYKTKSILI